MLNYRTVAMRAFLGITTVSYVDGAEDWRSIRVKAARPPVAERNMLWFMQEKAVAAVSEANVKELSRANPIVAPISAASPMLAAIKIHSIFFSRCMRSINSWTSGARFALPVSNPSVMTARMPLSVAPTLCSKSDAVSKMAS